MNRFSTTVIAVLSVVGMCLGQNAINPFEDNEALIALYHFNSGQGEAIVDESSNDITGR